MNTQNDSLLLVCGNLAPHAYLTLQLGIRSTHDYIIGSSNYRSSIAENLRSRAREYVPVWNAPFLDAPTVAELRAFLQEAVPRWRDFKNVVLWFSRYFPLDWGAHGRLLEKMHLCDDGAVVPRSNAVFSVPSRLIERIDVQQRRLSELEGLLRLEPEIGYSNISESYGIFQVSKKSTNTRYFNDIKASGAYLLKTVTKKGKARHEFNFLSKLPATMRPFYPCVGEFHEHPTAPSYEIEFLPMFDASRFLIHGIVDLDFFRNLLEKIDEYREACPRRDVGLTEVKRHLRMMFIDKLEERFKQLRELPQADQIMNYSNMIFDGGLGAGVSQLKERLAAAIDRVQERSLMYCHGDLCMSNILFDRNSRQLKLIDPRGADTVDELYMPWHYDLAKLSHSFVGGYDLINNDRSSLVVDAQLRMALRFEVPAGFLEEVAGLFRAWVQAQGMDFQFVSLCEASLFLSMLPLHSDRPKNIVQQMVAGANAMSRK